MHVQKNISIMAVYNMHKIKLHKTSKCLTVSIDMFCCEKNVFFFNVFINHFPKIHRNALHKITIDLLHF